MSKVKGVLKGVKCKEGNNHPKYGQSWQVSLNVDGEWYGGFINDDDSGDEDDVLAELGLQKGKLVTFSYSEKGKYKNFDPKSLVVSEASAADKKSAKASGGKGSYSSGGTAGIKVGHAINNAVALVAAGKVDIVDGSVLRTIHAEAVKIIALSVKLEGQFDAIVAKADDVYAKNVAESDGEDAGDEEEQAPKAKATRKKKAPSKPRKASKPKPDPEPEAEEDDDTPAPSEPDAEPDFDDDLPF